MIFASVLGIKNGCKNAPRISPEFARNLIRSRGSFWVDCGFFFGPFLVYFSGPFFDTFFSCAYFSKVLTPSAHNSSRTHIWVYLDVLAYIWALGPSAYISPIWAYLHASRVSGHIWAYLLIFGISGHICTYLAYLDTSGRICLYLVYLDVSKRIWCTWTYLGVSAYIW